MSARDQIDFSQPGQAVDPLGLLRFEEVSRRTALGRTAMYGLIKAGRFPAPVKVGGGSRWVNREIEHWVERLVDARDAKRASRSELDL